MPAIEFYDVPPGDDEGFLAAWQEGGEGVLLRAIRDDADPRYVSIAPGPGEYELVHEEGSVDEPGGVILIALSATDPGAFAGNRGYLGMRVYTGPRPITIARWSSPLMIQRAGVSYAALYQRVQPGAMVRMGALVAIADDQRPLGRSTSTYSVTDSQGNEISRDTEENDARLALRLVQFVDLDDGRRITADLGTLSVELDLTLAELREAVREMIFEADMLDVETGEQRWEDLIEILHGAGIDADEAALEALPFVVDLDDDVTQRVTL